MIKKHDVLTSLRSFSSEVKKACKFKNTRQLKYAKILSNETVKAIV